MNNPVNPQDYKKKEAMKSALLSAVVVPGAGQIYNGEMVKGILIAIVFAIASLTLLIPITFATIVFILGWSDPASPAFQESYQNIDPFTLIQEQQLSFITLLVVSVLLYIYAIVDAYKIRVKSS